MKKFMLSIIIPVYNEEKTLRKLLLKVNKIKLNKEIIIVNDGSTDKSRLILKENFKLYDRLIDYRENRGKGYACRIGIKHASGDLTIIQDADLEYNPNNYFNLIRKFEQNSSIEVVYGSRVLSGGKNIKPPGIRHYFSKFANFALTKFSNILNGQKLTDAHTCYKMVRTKILKKLDLKENGFAYCPEVTAKLSKLGLKIYEVPIDYHGRNHNEGKKIKTFHALEAIIALIKFNYPYRGYKKNWLRG